MSFSFYPNDLGLRLSDMAIVVLKQHSSHFLMASPAPTQSPAGVYHMNYTLEMYMCRT